VPARAADRLYLIDIIRQVGQVTTAMAAWPTS